MTNKEMDRIDSQFADVKSAIGRLDDAIRGNGKLGVLMRVDRLERSRAMHNKALWLVLVGSVGAAASWIRSFWG